jgi:hypothetical protein
MQSTKFDLLNPTSALHHIVFIAPLVCTMVATRNFSTFLAGSYVAAQTLTVGQAVQIGFAADHLQVCRCMVWQIVETNVTVFRLDAGSTASEK